MAPILSLPQESFNHIRADVSPSVVSIWAIDKPTGSKKRERREISSGKCFRSGFVYDYELGTCVILTLSKGLDTSKILFVQFDSGECFKATATLKDKESKLVAIVVTGLGEFKPKKITFSGQNAEQCEEVIHMGNFDEISSKLHFSSGLVGLVDHKVRVREGVEFTRFAHCCSEELYLLGGPVFNLRSEMVGINCSKRNERNIFFALDCEQIRRELRSLFGENMERLPGLFERAAHASMAKRRRK
ncbi:unnamed protein product [Urochloa humidicola]